MTTILSKVNKFLSPNLYDDNIHDAASFYKFDIEYSDNLFQQVEYSLLINILS